MPSRVEETLATVLKSQVIPHWERFALERLAVTAKTLQQFKAQTLPELFRVVVKKRIGQKVTRRSPRGYQNTSSYLAVWPEDNQAIFRFPALAFIVAGQADFHVADYLIRCPQNHFLLFADDVPRPTGAQAHLAGERLAQRHCVVLWFFMPPGTGSVTAYLCHSQGEEHWCEPYHIVHCPEAIHLFKLSLQELQEKPKNYRLIATLGWQTFLHVFLRELEEGRFHQAGKSSAATFPTATTSPIAQAQEYVQAHLRQSLTAHKVAREVYMSRTNFIRHFRRETGQTFHDYVTAQRMEEAERLLREGEWSLSFIRQFIGLRPTQFLTQFKKHTGLTPAEFRRRYIKKHKTDES